MSGAAVYIVLITLASILLIVIGLVIFYFIAKGAVKNGVIEAYNIIMSSKDQNNYNNYRQPTQQNMQYTYPNNVNYNNQTQSQNQ